MQPSTVSTARLEAFSDGIIAILITLMVFDLKFPEEANGEGMSQVWRLLAPRWVSYIFSFITLAIMWVNHHQLFHQVRHTDQGLVWHNIHLLFWMSAVPFATHIIGSRPWHWQAVSFYGLVFFMSALAFTLLRSHALRKGLLLNSHYEVARRKIITRNLPALSMYLLGASVSPWNVFISFAIYALVPVMYIRAESKSFPSD